MLTFLSREEKKHTLMGAFTACYCVSEPANLVGIHQFSHPACEDTGNSPIMKKHDHNMWRALRPKGSIMVFSNSSLLLISVRLDVMA